MNTFLKPTLFYELYFNIRPNPTDGHWMSDSSVPEKPGLPASVNVVYQNRGFHQSVRDLK